MADGERFDTSAAPASDATETDPPNATTAGDGSGLRGFVDHSRARLAAEQARIGALIDENHDRPLLDVALRIYQRDREAASSLVGSALAFRLYLFFVPLALFVVGVLGLLASWVGPTEIIDATGVGGTIADQVNTAMSQPNSTRWIAALVGLFGMAWAGRSLSKVMVSASCLAWRLPVTRKASLRVIGSVIGLIGGIVMVAAIVNNLRQDHGLAVAGLSFVAVFAVYGVAWMAISMLLPRATRDPGALLPGAVVVGAVLTVLQAVSQLYLPEALDRASVLYGTLATTIVTLGWFFFAGRAIVFGMALDAVLYERFGSISQFVFALPVMRVLPRRSAWVRSFFDLESEQPPRF